MKFVGRKINSISETIGERLFESRKKLNLSLEEVSKELGIKKDYIIALEENNYDLLPEGLYKETFLRKYCEFLDIDWKKIKKEFNNNVKEKINKFEFSPKKINKFELLIFPKIFRNIFTAIIISIFFLYIGFYIKTSISPPNIQIIEPIDNLVTDSRSINVIGIADAQTQININGVTVLSNEEGFFEKEVDLKQGVNTITISAEKKQGRKKIIQKQILVE